MKNEHLSKAFESLKSSVDTLGRELKMAGAVDSRPAVIYYDGQEYKLNLVDRVTGKLKTKCDNLLKAIPINKKLVEMQEALKDFDGDPSSTDANYYLIKQGVLSAEEVVEIAEGKYKNENSRTAELVNFEIFRSIYSLPKNAPDSLKEIYDCSVIKNPGDKEEVVDENVLDLWDDQDIIMIRQEVSSFRRKVGI